MGFGFANDGNELIRAISWRDAAIADGWQIKATYEGHEGIDAAWSLHRDGWAVLGITRTNDSPVKRNYQVIIHIWAPDGLAVEPPAVYNFEELVRNSRTCKFCKAQNVDTQRVGFAGRCCAACLPDARKRIETKGWCDYG